MPAATRPDAPTTFTFDVLFEGLVALVPLKAPDAADTGKFLLALPDLFAGGPVDDRLPRIIPPHVACVVVPAKCVADPDHSGADLEFRLPDPDDEQFPMLDDERYQIFAFNRERLTLEHDGPLVLSSTGAIGTPTQESPATDLAWVPTLRETHVLGSDEFEGRLLAKNLAPGTADDLNYLVGTFVPTSGTLSTNGLVVRDDGSPEIFEFRDKQGTSRFERAMFNRLVLYGEAPRPSLQMVFTDQYEEKRSVELVPDANGKLGLKIVNLELEEIVGLGSYFPRPPASLDEDLDFAVSYWLSRAWSSVKPEDVVIPHAEGRGPGGSGPPCRTAGYQGLVGYQE